MAKKEDGTYGLFANIEGETEQVKQALAQLKVRSIKRYHIAHGAKVMALSMRIKRLAHVPADKLYLWSFKRYERAYRKGVGKPCPPEELERAFVFHYGRDIVLKQLKGGAR
ncbi:MAG: hypothetical protein WBP93_05330 [Pyrinomonadaceae bacterium]